MYEEITFRTPATYFGMDALSHVGKEASKLGAGKVLVVTGPTVKKAGILDKALSFLKAEDLTVEVNIQDRDTPEPATDATEASIPFPWAPSPTRPKRTPPQSRQAKPAEPPAEAAPPADPSAEKGPTQPGPDVGPVELTPEELAALMGRRPPDSSSPPREGPP